MPRRPLVERLHAGETLLADGGMGSMLLGRGLEPGACPESINLERPEIVEEIARLYLEAGADVIETNTFGASAAKLAQYSLADRAAEINRAAVQAARNAVGDRAYVAGSCGPSGRILKPYGDADPDELYDGFLEQARALIEAGVDLICVETMIDLTEATLAVRATKAVEAAIPVAAAMTFDSTPRGFYTVMGVTVGQAAAGLGEAGADLVGSNCGNGSENMLAIAAEFRKCTELPLIVQPNAGLPEMKDGQVVYGETPAFMANKGKGLLAAGVSIIGGCCGTTPEHTAALRKMIDSAGHF
jgi:5-methyltetrahydrofolate--homocysteine methyltransferase